MNDHTQDFTTMDDDRLLALLGSALAKTDPVPAAVTEFAKAGFAWRDIDAELAELVFDSAMEELVGVRSATETREVTFRAPGVEIEVAVVSEDARRIIGQLVPPQPARIELRFGGETQRTESDDLGRFTLHGIPKGPISLRFELGDGQAVQTDWVIV